MQRTLIIFKPDAIQRGLCGTLMQRFEKKGLRLLACKLIKIDPELAQQHYAEHQGKDFFDGLIDFITSGPSMVMCWEGLQAISVCRKMMGATSGIEAEPGTIRGDFTQFRSFNLVHGSDSIEAAERELGLFFKADELVNYVKSADLYQLGPEGVAD